MHIFVFFGVALSVGGGILTAYLESRREHLEKEVKHKDEELIQKKSESRKAEIASAAIYQSSRILFSDTKTSHLIKTVVDLMLKVLRADEGSLMLLDEHNKLTIASSRGIPEDVAKRVQLNLGERVAGRVAELRREFLIVGHKPQGPLFRGLPAPLPERTLRSP